MRASNYIRSNLLGLVAIFIALSGTAMGVQTINEKGGLKANSVKSKHIKNHQVKNPDLAKKAVGPSKLALNAVGPFQLADSAFRPEDIDAQYAGLSKAYGIPANAIQSDEISDATIQRVDLAEEARGPAGYERRDNDTGEICNGFCTEGSLTLPPGFYAISGKIVLDQQMPEAVSVNCQLTSGGVVFDHGAIFQSTDHGVVTLHMQGARLLLDEGNVNLNCKDFGVGSVFGFHLNMIAINLGSASSSTPDEPR